MLDLSVIVPAYNEAARLPATLDVLAGHLGRSGRTSEIVVVDDGSTDATRAVVHGRSSSGVAVGIVTLQQNRGKGKAVATGVAASRGRVVAFIDADLPYTLANLDHAVDAIARGEADAALGARDLDESSYDPSYPLARQIAGRSYAALVRLTLGLPFGDTQCGLKSFDGELARRLFPLLTIDGYGFDVELAYLVCSRGYRITRFPVTLSHRHDSRVRLVRDSLRMFGDLWRVRRNERRGAYGPFAPLVPAGGGRHNLAS